MALAQHELSAPNIVIPFSLNPPPSCSPVRPVTFELELSQYEQHNPHRPHVPRQHLSRLRYPWRGPADPDR
ncbi:hypothetical protein C1886_00120 [Pseudomonas sp. FW300-N1A1]|nr:hypothetical protein C1886_00120 [Pseudomonas sp. FW300-N1A1]